MSYLIKCIECGESISNTAAKCVHCGTNCPQGMECTVCRKILRLREGKWTGPYGRKFMHKDCFDKITPYSVEYKYTCPVCGYLITSIDMHLCSKCGEAIAWKHCDVCQLRISHGTEVETSNGSWFHKECYAGRYPSGEYNPKAKGKNGGCLIVVICFAISCFLASQQYKRSLGVAFIAFFLPI